MAEKKGEDTASELSNQPCPMCHKNTLTLREDEREIPYFGQAYIFSMTCSECKYHKADVEAAEKKEPSKYEIDIEKEEDMKIRVVKSSTATIKIPHITTVTPGIASNGYVTNVEGILGRVKKVIESAKNDEEDEDTKKKAKNLLKKLQRVMWGQDKLKLIIEDPDGNSAIISERAKVSKLKI
ncbi:ZPR1 zinc finger domain-containing protein [Candidatus Woesearchaeota archaeon]|nr:ZPR1 zinc finger domain-containing protein [Candidatus Woesearchaeota archaeon]